MFKQAQAMSVATLEHDSMILRNKTWVKSKNQLHIQLYTYNNRLEKIWKTSIIQLFPGINCYEPTKIWSIFILSHHQINYFDIIFLSAAVFWGI